MRRKRELKCPNGAVIEEYVTTTAHYFHDGKLIGHNNDPEGDYTGRFAFAYHPDSQMTRWYIEKTAPRWLLEMRRRAILPE